MDIACLCDPVRADVRRQTQWGGRDFYGYEVVVTVLAHTGDCGRTDEIVSVGVVEAV